MMENVIHFLIPGLVLLVIYGLLHFSKAEQLVKSKIGYGVILGVILVIQLAAVGTIRQQVGDVKLFGLAGYYFRNGVDFYTIDQDHSQYPFFPFLIFVHGILNFWSMKLKLFPFVAYLKIILLAALYLISFWIKDRRSQLKFLTSPITYAVVLFHGQIDVILLAFLIGSLEVLKRWNRKWWGMILAGVLYAASVATKTWSVIFAPLLLKFFGWKNAVVIGLVAAVFLAIDVGVYKQMVYKAEVAEILTAVTKPGGPVGIWGLAYILQPWKEMVAKNNLVIFGGLLAFGLGLIWKTQKDLVKSIMLLILWVYLIIPNWGVQYLFWVLPFMFAMKNIRFQTSYMLMAGLYVWLNYINVAYGGVLVPVSLIHNFGLVVWGMILFWFVKLVKEKNEA